MNFLDEFAQKLNITWGKEVHLHFVDESKSELVSWLKKNIEGLSLSSISDKTLAKQVGVTSYFCKLLNKYVGKLLVLDNNKNKKAYRDGIRTYKWNREFISYLIKNESILKEINSIDSLKIKPEFIAWMKIVIGGKQA